jgi:WhiB family redox-sensing transcriptional regulator
MTNRDDLPGPWQTRAVCASLPPAEKDRIFLPRLGLAGAHQADVDRKAKEICSGCPVRIDCQLHALNHDIVDGTWGGLTAHERKVLKHRANIVGRPHPGPVTKAAS